MQHWQVLDGVVGGAMGERSLRALGSTDFVEAQTNSRAGAVVQATNTTHAWEWCIK